MVLSARCWVGLGFIGGFFWQCTPEREYIELTGSVFGTYYAIQYKSSQNFQKNIDSLFRHYSAAVNIYDTASEISEFNRNGQVNFRSPYLKSLLEKATVLILSEAGSSSKVLQITK